MQSQQLLTESEVFKGEILSGPEGTDSPSQEMTEQCGASQNHGQNLIEIRRIKPVSKSFILCVHEVLTRDKPFLLVPWLLKLGHVRNLPLY